MKEASVEASAAPSLIWRRWAGTNPMSRARSAGSNMPGGGPPWRQGHAGHRRCPGLRFSSALALRRRPGGRIGSSATPSCKLTCPAGGMPMSGRGRRSLRRMTRRYAQPLAELANEPDAWTQFVGLSPDGAQAIIGRWQSPENAHGRGTQDVPLHAGGLA